MKFHSRFRAALVVALAAGAASVFSTIIAYQTTLADGRVPNEFALAALNSSFWFGWALLAVPLTRIAARWRLDRQPRAALLIHGAAALAAGAVHIAMQAGVQAALYVKFDTGWANEAPVLTVWLARWRAVLPEQVMLLIDWELLAGIAVVALTHAVLYRREAQERALREAQLETRLIEAQLQTLRQQLHPHFLFNTLHAVSALMHRDVEAANTVLVRLSELLRMSLESGGDRSWPLSKELEFLHKYLEIERARLGDRLTVDFDVEPELYGASVPSLILQPLVENAVKHGIAPHTTPGRVEVRAFAHNGCLHMEVRDNGPAPDPAAAPRSTFTQGGGIGLVNVRSRLAHEFGDLGRLDTGRRDSGFIAAIELPLRI